MSRTLTRRSSGFPGILGADGLPHENSTPLKTRKALRASYDAAQTTDNNRRHWANADYLLANEATSYQVRRTLRSRARYEVANNCYAKGIVRTLASEVVGTGPRLQILTEDPKVNQAIEERFSAWSRRIGLAEKLRIMRAAISCDGESFAVFTTDFSRSQEISLDLVPVEADRVTQPMGVPETEDMVDGIRYDVSAQPKSYTVLRSYPGLAAMQVSLPIEYDTLPASRVIHWYFPDRAGQSRGVPELTPALPLFAMLRRYTLAVLAAAESAADWALVFTTNQPPDEVAAAVPMDWSFETESRMGVFAPEGWKPEQIRAEQPATTYEMFKREILNEIARCLDVPYNVAAGNSSSYNYASGRLDHQTYARAIEVQRDHAETIVLDRLLAEWLREASLLPGFLPASDPWAQLPRHEWFWTGREHVDPAKEAAAQSDHLGNYTTTLAIEYAKQGLDWEAALRQRAREIALMGELNLPVPDANRAGREIDRVAERMADEVTDRSSGN